MGKNKIKLGTYTHFKGKNYIVYGKATDMESNMYVLYKQNYGDKSFWIRPYSNFFEKIPEDPKTRRFKLVSETDSKVIHDELELRLKDKPFVIKHSETGEQYLIYSIPEDVDAPIKLCTISSINDSQSAYLTDFQIAQRMGYYLYNFKGDRKVSKSPIPQETSRMFTIDGDGTPSQTIEEYLTNPCSLDLRIAEDFFCKPTHKKIDLISMLRYHTTSADLWKKKKPKNRNNTKEIVLRPGETIITHTHEKISLPTDCAGKIEIKSTYARLALSISTSDFCNPGWKGYFPLIIHNNGKHKIVLHPKEKMLQLMLIPTQAPIISEYSQNSTFMNDDGTPFLFWQSRTAKQFRKQHKLDEIIDFYEKVLCSIDTENCSDVEGCKDRFANTFLLFCERSLHKEKYKKMNNNDKTKELWKAYKRSEQIKKNLSTVRFGSILVSLLPTFITIVCDLIKNKTVSMSSTLICCGIASIILLVVSILWLIKFPKLFCTFEKFEYDKIIKSK